MEEGILKNLKEGNIDIFCRDIERYISIFTSLEQPERDQKIKFLYFTEDLLRVFSTYLHKTEAVGISEVQEIVSRVEKCYKLHQDSNCGLINFIHTNRSFYHIIVNLIRLGYYQEAILLSPYLFHNITKTCMSDEIETMINNLYISFWNSAMEPEQSKDPSFSVWIAFSLRMRQIALRFLSLKQSHFQKVCEQSSKALIWYVTKAKNEMCNNEVEIFCTDIWHFIMKSQNSVNVKDNVMATVSSIFVMLKDWVRTLMRYTALQNIPLDLLTNLEDVLCLVKTASNKMLVNIGSASISVTKYCVKLLKMFRENPLKCCEDWDMDGIKINEDTLLLLNAETAGVLSSFIDSALSICMYCLLEMVTLNETEKDSFQFANISYYIALVECLVTFFIKKEDYVWNKIDGQPIFASLCRILGGTIMILRKEIQNITDKDHIKDFIMKARSILELLSAIMNMNNRKYSLEKEYIYFGNNICNFGVVCFGKEMHKETIEFLELGLQYLNKVLHLEDSSIPEKAFFKKNIWKNYELLSHSYFASGQFEMSLKIIVDGLIANSFKVSSVIDLWIKIKREMNRKNIIHSKKRTLKQEIEKNGIKIDEQYLIPLLFAELQAYRSEKYDTEEECYNVAICLIKLCQNPLERARAFIELTRIIWLYGDKYMFCGRSSVECCMEALEVLKELKLEGNNLITMKFLQSLANFWLYQTQIKNLQSVAQREIEKLPSTAKEVTSMPRGDEEDGAEACDINPAFSYLNIQIQQNAMEPLNQALQLWQELIDLKVDFTGILSVQDLLELLDVVRTAAEIYALSQKDIEELKAWSILRKVAIVLNNPITELQALSMLITILSRQNLLEAAKSFIEEGEIISEKVVPLGPVDPYANLSKLKFQLAISKYLFHSEQFTTGLNLLWTILTSPFLERQTKSSTLLIAEAKMVLCYYSMLCPKVFSTISELNEELHKVIETGTPINLALDSIKLCIGLLRHISSGEKANQEFPWYKLYLTRIFLDCGLLLGELYINIGAPKEARCFLSESLSAAQELILANRAASLLMLLAQLDLLCDNNDDCTVKLKGLTYILQFTNSCIEYHDAMQGKQPLHTDDVSEIEAEECEQFIKNKSGRTLKGEVRHQLMHVANPQTSPTTKTQQKIVIPSFFNHSDTCFCQYCQYFSLHNCFLEVIALQSSLLCSTAKKKKLLEDILKYQQILLIKRNNNLKIAISYIFIKKDIKVLDSIQLIRSDLRVLCNIYNKLSILAMDQNKYQDASYYLQSAFLLLSNSSKLYEILYADLFSALIYSKAMIYLHHMISKNKKIALNYFDVMGELIDNHYQKQKSSSDVSHLIEEIKVLNLKNEDSLPKECSDLFSSPLTLPMKTPSKSLMKVKNINYSKVCNAPRRKRAPNICLETYINSLENGPLEQESLAVFDNDSKNESIISIKPSRKTRLQTQGQKISDKKLEQFKQKLPAFDSVEEYANNDDNKEKKTNNSNCTLQTSTLKQSRNVLCEKNDVYLFNIAEDNLECEKENVTNKTLHSKRIIATEPRSSRRRPTTRKNSISRKIILPRENIENERGANSDDDLLLTPDFIMPKIMHLWSKSNCINNITQTNHSNKEVSEITGSKVYDESPQEAFRINDSSPSRIVSAVNSTKKRCGKSSVNKVKTVRKLKNDIVGRAGDRDYALIPSSTTRKHSNSSVIQNVECNFKEKKTEYTEFLSITLEEIYSELKHAVLAIRHHPPCPLYSKMCVTMSLFVLLMKKQGKHDIQDNDRFLASYYIAESSAVTLKHLAMTALNKKIKRCTYTTKESTVEANGTNHLEIRSNILKQDLLNYRKNINVDDSMEIKRIMDDLPKEWTIVQVCALPSTFRSSSQEEQTPPTILVTRFRAENIPVSAVMDNVTDNAFTENFLMEFNTILKESAATMEKIDAKIWWNVRRDLDFRMKNLINSMENTWLGCWKGLFLGIPVENSIKERMREIILEIIAVAESFNLKCTDKYLLEVLLHSSYLLSDSQLSTAISCLWKCSTLDTRGKQLLLAIRKSAIDINFGRIRRHPVILILDKEVQALPWESMSLFHNQSVSRVPSLSLLHAQLAVYNLQPDCIFKKGVDTQLAFYILNPSNDIPDTQLKFQTTFKKQKGWDGVIGRPPTQQEFSSALTDHDLFIYCGHGTGRVYLAAECIERLKCRATTILMGCSSGKLKTYGNQLEPHGVVLQYWLSGSPCIVANLWDVTDKDIDRFTEFLLKSWLPAFQEKCVNNYEMFVTDAVQSARKACRLPYLIGSAPVIYGLPVFTS